MGDDNADTNPRDALSIAGFSLLALTLLLLPYHLYQIKQFASNLASVALLRRYPYLVLALDVLLVLFAYGYGPYHVLVVTTDLIHAPSWTSWMIFSLVCHGCSWVYLLRSFLLYFDFQYHKALSDTAWVTALKEDHAEHNWFLNNHRTYGNGNWLASRIFVPLYVLSVVLGTISAKLLISSDNKHSSIVVFHPINLVLTMIPWFGVIYVWFKMRFHDVHDFFKIREEMVEGCMITVLAGAVYGAEYVVFVLFSKLLSKKEFVKNDETRVRLDALLFFFICSCWGQALIWVSTTRVLHKNDKYLSLTLDKRTLPTRTDNVTKEQALKQIKTHASGLKIHGTAVFDRVQAELIVKARSMAVYLAHRRGFQLFMQHLVREFATENLLFLVQLHQWKDGLRRKRIPKKKFRAELLKLPWKWPSSVPKPSFFKTEKDSLRRAYLLFEKYICEDSAEHWVNLRGTTYKELKAFFNKYGGDATELTLDSAATIKSKKASVASMIELYELFDKAENEVIHLLESSWDRFQTSAEYVTEKDSSDLSVSQSGAGGGGLKSMTSRAYGNIVTDPIQVPLRKEEKDDADIMHPADDGLSPAVIYGNRLKPSDSQCTPMLLPAVRDARDSYARHDSDLGDLSMLSHSRDNIEMHAVVEVLFAGETQAIEREEEERAVMFAADELVSKDDIREDSRQDKAEGQQLNDEEIEDYSDEEVAEYARTALAKMGSASKANNYRRSEALVLGRDEDYAPDAIQPVVDELQDSEATTPTTEALRVSGAVVRPASTSELPAMSLTPLVRRHLDLHSKSDMMISSESEGTDEPTTHSGDRIGRHNTVSAFDGRPSMPELPPSMPLSVTVSGDTYPRTTTDTDSREHYPSITPLPMEPGRIYERMAEVSLKAATLTEEMPLSFDSSTEPEHSDAL